MAPGGEEEKATAAEQYAGVVLVPLEQMDPRPLFQAVDALCQDNIKHFGESKSEVGSRLVQAFTRIQEQAYGAEPSIRALAAVCPLFDLDPDTPANGYRSLLKVVLACTQHILHKCRYITSSRHSLFFRAAHNCAELEAYGAALTQLRALLCFAQRLLTANSHGDLFFRQERGLSEEFLHEYSTMHKGCFYGRCMGFQFTPSIRPFLQTIAIGLVSFGENYKRHESGISVAASSIFISGRYAIDPELRGAEFERITQNLDVNFWKTFWNITEMELLTSLVGITSSTVRINKILSVPPEPLEMPLSSDPQRTVTINPPVAHTGPGPVNMRLISYQLREGQESEELNSFTKPEGPLSLDLRLRSRPAALSPDLIIHFHGGGFVAQTSKSHEPYLKTWAQELEAPILSVDYSLAPEAPFPRALEECFYAYCWALRHCRLLGSTGERICLAGDSAGGNLCITVSLRAASVGIRLPDGIMVAYPATLLQATASPSRLLTLMDPLLPLSVLSKCLGAYAGTERVPVDDRVVEKQSTVNLVKRGTALFLRDIRQGAASWLSNLMEGSKERANPDTVRKSLSEAALVEETSLLNRMVSLKSKTCQDLNHHHYIEQNNLAVGTSSQQNGEDGAPNKHAHREAQSHNSSSANGPHSPSSLSIQSGGSDPLSPSSPKEAVNFFLTESESEGDQSFDRESSTHSKENIPPAHSGEDRPSPHSPTTSQLLGFPEGFQPLRSKNGVANMTLQTSAIVDNPYMSPLLAPDSMLLGLPPIHIVACALDPMLDDSVMFAKRLRSLNRPVTLKVVEDLPHGFLSLSQLSPETRAATAVCVQRIRQVLREEPPAPPSSAPRKHRKLERTLGKSAATDREIGA
ncbi:PREDICTED: hormone-sensitive lipase isoform X2 [Nanorana parkeri]|uniref:hormone-sensitive lipase isoform X2 n=1 Tax=Nanorana parkeri TaxID=125878 RepID=UPI00085489ED|nr:PREDICTED: hormone-sensitive lipase isoform X2 [Nanorana parkeri]